MLYTVSQRITIATAPLCASRNVGATTAATPVLDDRDHPLNLFYGSAGEMAEQRKPIEDLVRDLPPEFQEEVRDFVQFLLGKRGQKPGRTLRQDWAGALREYREQYTALELQQKALQWRGD